MASFQEQIEELNRLLLQMASRCEEQVEKALTALKEQQKGQARLVILRDNDIDNLELQVDELVLRILALHQPVATDLRFLLAAQKINNDLERVADHAVNIAEAAIALSDAPHIKPLVNIPKMADLARAMLKQAIDSFVYRDAAMARAVKEQDDEIDQLHRLVKEKLASTIQEHPEHFHRALHLIAVSTDLERIADLSTNIAEEVVFITEAEVLKHQDLQSEQDKSLSIHP